MLRGLAALAILLLAGCATPDDAPASTATPADAEPFRVSIARTGHEGGEPTLAVTSEGTLLVTVFGIDRLGPAVLPRPSLLRSTDEGATWQPAGTDATASPVSLDPWLAHDPATNRVYESQLLQGCSTLRWSDDAGSTWTAAPLAGCGLPGHDHQKLAVGPPPSGLLTLGYPSLLYYAHNALLPAPACYQSTCARFGTVVSTSVDGGRTWPLSAVAHPSDPCHRGINGAPAVATDGTVVVPKPVCGGVSFAVSTNGGATWQIEPGFVEEPRTTHFWVKATDAAADGAGGVYAVWRGEDAGVHLARRDASGWSEPLRVSPPEIRATAFAAVAAGGPGEAVVAYLGTTSDPAGWPSLDPSDAPADTVWHLEVGILRSGELTTIRPMDTPAQVGCIWLRGGDSACRNLYDFLDVATLDAQAYVAFTDGCGGCDPAAGQSRAGEVVVAIVGPSG